MMKVAPTERESNTASENSPPVHSLDSNPAVNATVWLDALVRLVAGSASPQNGRSTAPAKNAAERPDSSKNRLIAMFYLRMDNNVFQCLLKCLSLYPKFAKIGRYTFGQYG